MAEFKQAVRFLSLYLVAFLVPIPSLGRVFADETDADCSAGGVCIGAITCC